MAKKDKKSSDDRNYKVIKKFGYLNSDKKKILAKIAWYDKDAKYDIRKCWDKEGELMIGTGISVSRKELKELRDLIDKVLDTDEEDEEEEEDEPDSDGRTPVNLDDVLSSVPGILDKREAGYTTEDGFIRLKAKPGHTMKLKPAPKYDD